MCFIDGRPCTSLERTVLDCCLMFSVRQAVILVDHASRMGADLAQLRSRCGGQGGRRKWEVTTAARAARKGGRGTS
jgi:hypothetical protein